MPAWNTWTAGLCVGLGLASAGCTHRALITSDPPGAEVRLGKQYVGITPVEVEISRIPFTPNRVRVNMPGRRWADVRIRRFKRHSEHEVLLIRSHGRSGTWTPEDAER